MAIAAVACAAGMILARNPVHAALWLVGNFVALAVIYLILSAPMLFAMQLIVYAGAIMVLFLFVIMFFTEAKARRWLRQPPRTQTMLAVVLIAAFFLVLFWGLTQAGVFLSLKDVSDGGIVTEPFVPAENNAMGQPKELGMWLFNYQVLPFELIGVLLTIALLGSVMAARDRRAEGRAALPGAAADQGRPGHAEAKE
jgi:NADH-quinone oxidoreductase subunit J